MKIILILMSALFILSDQSDRSVHQFTMKSIDGEDISLSEYKGKVMLIVNVASKCGYTPQYEGLQKLYEKYRDRGFVVLGFPANNFMGQEPGTNEQIKSFCEENFGVTFPMFAKISVKGNDQAELYAFLTDKSKNGNVSGEVKWNFQKYLIDKDGIVVKKFSHKTEPLNKELVARIEELL